MRQIKTHHMIWTGASLRVAGAVLVLATIIMALGIRAGLATSVALREGDLASLQQGRILLEIIHPEEPGGAARISALFHTNAASIWNIIGYCKYEFIYLKGLKSCEVLEPGLFKTRVRHRLKTNWYAPTLDYSFDASRGKDNHGEFQLVAGDLKVLQGQWSLRPLVDDGEVIVTHQIRIQPKFPTPKWLIRHSLRRDLPNMLACIRGLANASGDPQRVANDLNRCPGANPGQVTGQATPGSEPD